jgi:hypothetical protein
MIELDRTETMLLNMLAEHIENEPVQVNENMPLPQQDEVATEHAQWQSRVNACYLLLGVRLVNAALDARDSS